MKILWYGSHEIAQWLCPGCVCVAGKDFDSIETNNEWKLVVEANFGPGDGSSRNGLRWLAGFRRQTQSSAPAVIFSLESKDRLQRDFPIVAAQELGVHFLQAPFNAIALQTVLAELRSLTIEQLVETLRWHSGIQEIWRQDSHTFGQLLANWPRERSLCIQIIEKWDQMIRAFAPDQTNAIEILRNTLEEDVLKIRLALQILDEGLNVQEPGRKLMSLNQDLDPAPVGRPPFSFDSVAIADDNGYELSTMTRLQQLGYMVFGPARRLQEAERLFRNSQPSVVLADLNFPSSEEGTQLLELALRTASVRIVIATSRSKAAVGSLPGGVEDCCGAMSFQDAERIHRLIWRRAKEQGIIDHV